MKEISDKELLSLQLDIFRDVDAFCRDNQIEYFLVGGTGIGAVRHGGYIPWDDDIDIGMTRPNYNKFISLFNGNFTNLAVFAPEIDWNYYAPYANVCDLRTVLYERANGHNGQDIGVKIDVFPYDGVPSDSFEFESLRNKALELTRLCSNKRFILSKMKFNIDLLSVKTVLKTVLTKIGLMFTDYSTLQKQIHLLSQVVPYESAEYLEKIVFPYRNNKPCRREIFESYIDVPFEDLTVRNITKYDEYLRSVFGDYMQLPPENQRVKLHGFKAFWKD